MSIPRDVELASLVQEIGLSPYFVRGYNITNELDKERLAKFQRATDLVKEILTAQCDPWFDVPSNYPEILTKKVRAFMERLP